MKKSLLSVLLVVALSVTALAGVEYTLSGIDYSVVVNGKPMVFTDVVPMNYNGRTMLPLRAVSEALGIPIEWDGKQVNIDTIDLDKLKDSCVKVQVGKNGQYTSQGSGVAIDYDEVLTCYHVVDGVDYYEIIYDDRNTANVCTVKNNAPTKDAATLTPPNKTIKPVKIGDSDEVKVGDNVYVISSPIGDKNVVTKSSILNTDWTNNGINGFTLKSTTQGGSSGGGIFNLKGELIGILTAGDNITDFAIPINAIRQALAS